MPTESQTASLFDKRNAMLIQMILDCGYGDLPVERAIEVITKAIRKARRMK